MSSTLSVHYYIERMTERGIGRGKEREEGVEGKEKEREGKRARETFMGSVIRVLFLICVAVCCFLVSPYGWLA